MISQPEIRNKWKKNPTYFVRAQGEKFEPKDRGICKKNDGSKVEAKRRQRIVPKRSLRRLKRYGLGKSDEGVCKSYEKCGATFLFHPERHAVCNRNGITPKPSKEENGDRCRGTHSHVQ